MKIFIVTSAFEGDPRQINAVFFSRRDAENWIFNESVKLGFYDPVDMECVEITGIKVTGKVKRQATLQFVRESLDACGMDDCDEREFVKELRKIIKTI